MVPHRGKDLPGMSVRAEGGVLKVAQGGHRSRGVAVGGGGNGTGGSRLSSKSSGTSSHTVRSSSGDDLIAEGAGRELDLSVIEEMANKRALPSLSGDVNESYSKRTIREAWQGNLPSLEGPKLSLVGDSITAIGELPESLTLQVQTLYLSNNYISSLGGIEQLKGLRNLSMANNLIRYLGQLRVLEEVSVLEKLSLEGNPVSNMPFYRMCVLSLCPHLVILDGKKVSIEERRMVSGHMREVNHYFETLRKNELRNVVLLHLANSLTCNSELYEFLRPPTEEGQYFHQNLNQSTSKAFRILLVGGVYRWLQATGADNFDCVVQSLNSTLHVQMLQGYSSNEKASIQSSPGSLYRHWKSVVEGCIRYQEDLSMRLISTCQVQKGGTTPQETENTTEILCALQELNFEELSSDREYELLYRGEPAKSRRGALAENLSQSMVDRYQRILKQSAMREGLYGGVDTGVDTSTQSASLAPSLPPQQSEPESPMTKVFDADLQTETNLDTHWTDEITSPLKKERGADNVSRHRQLGSPIRAGKKAMSALESKLDFSDERVVRFLNRSLLVDNEKVSNEEATVLGRDIVGEWLHVCASAKAMAKLDSDVGLEIRLGPSPHLQPHSTLEAKSMSDLKEHVQDALTDLTISQRESYMCWSISEALQKQAGKVRSVMSAAEDKVHSKLDVYYSMIKLLNDDVADGTRWVQSVQSLLAEVDEGKGQLSNLRESTKHSDSNRQRFVAMKEKESVKKGSLLSSIHEANMAISSMSAQLFKNPNAPKKKISRVRSILDRVEEMESRSLLLIARTFRHFRCNTAHQRRVKASICHMRVVRLKRLRRSTFIRWTMLLHGSYKRRLVTLRAESALVRVMFRQWIVAYNSEYRVRRYLVRKHHKAQRHFFRQMETIHISNVKTAKRERKQDVVVTCFTMVRLFRAWKQYFLKSRLPLDVDAKYTLLAHVHFKRNLFRAWWQLCLDAEAEQKAFRTQFLERKDDRLRARCFKDWSIQFRARNLLRYKLCVKALLSFRSAVSRGKRAMQFQKWSVEFNTQTQQFNHRYSAFLALHFFAHKRKSVRIAAEKVRYRKKRRMVHSAWSVMIAQYMRNARLSDLVSIIVDHGSTRKLRYGFKQWHKLLKRPTLESLPASHTYFDDETIDDISRLEAAAPIQAEDLAQSISLVDNEDGKKVRRQAPLQQDLVKYRGVLLTREQVEVARLERMVDEDFYLVGTRFYNRKASKNALSLWSRSISKRGKVKANYYVLHRKSSHRLKRRYFSRLTTSWLSKITATRLELSKDIGIGALDTERSKLLLECSNYRTQIIRQQERAHYLNEKLVQVGASAETAQRNLEDTNASLSVLKSERDATRQAISRLQDESQTIKIMAEGLSTPSYVREEADQDLEAMLNTEETLRSHNAELLIGVESNYKRAVDIEVEAKKEHSKIKAESQAVHEVTTQQEKELALIEQQIQGLLAEKEDAEAHLSNATKSFEHAINDIKSRKESIEKQIIEVDHLKSDARDRYIRAQKEESELKVRVRELRTKGSNSVTEDSISPLAPPRQEDFGEASVMSSLDHVTESRALLESALLKVAELRKRDELLSGDAFTRNLAEMEEKRLNSFLVPEEHSGDEAGEGHSSSYQEMAADLEKINVNALELLDESRTLRQSSLRGSRGTGHNKRPSVLTMPTKRTTSTAKSSVPKASTTYASNKVSVRGEAKKIPVTKKRQGKARAESNSDVKEPRSEQEINKEISSISERLKQRLNTDW